MVVATATLVTPISVEDLLEELKEIERKVEKRVQDGELVSPEDIKGALRRATLAIVLRIRDANEDGVLPVEMAEAITTWRKQLDAALSQGA